MNSPGVQSKPRVSPLAQNTSNGSSSPAAQFTSDGSVPPPPPPPPSMGSLAMGMPFQVFPNEPPARNNQKLSAPQTNGNRKSPQSFEPPPMGCRPEIKIPANPMATLRKTPKPQEKNDFWLQEYYQEKAGDSMPSEEETQQQQQSKLPTPPPRTHECRSPDQYVQRVPSPPEQKDYGTIRNVKLEDVRTASPVQAHRSSPVMRQSPLPSNVSSSPMSLAKTVVATFEPTDSYEQPQTYQQPTQSYQQPAQTYQRPAQVYQQPSHSYPQTPQSPQKPAQSYQQQQPTQGYQQQQPTQDYQQPTQSFQQPTQSYQQPPKGGRVILSTMPKGAQLNTQQHVSKNV